MARHSAVGGTLGAVGGCALLNGNRNLCEIIAMLGLNATTVILMEKVKQIALVIKS